MSGFAATRVLASCKPSRCVNLGRRCPARTHAEIRAEGEAWPFRTCEHDLAGFRYADAPAQGVVPA